MTATVATRKAAAAAVAKAAVKAAVKAALAPAVAAVIVEATVVANRPVLDSRRVLLADGMIVALVSSSLTREQKISSAT